MMSDQVKRRITVSCDQCGFEVISEDFTEPVKAIWDRYEEAHPSQHDLRLKAKTGARAHIAQVYECNGDIEYVAAQETAEFLEKAEDALDAVASAYDLAWNACLEDESTESAQLMTSLQEILRSTGRLVSS